MVRIAFIVVVMSKNNKKLFIKYPVNITYYTATYISQNILSYPMWYFHYIICEKPSTLKKLLCILI